MEILLDKSIKEVNTKEKEIKKLNSIILNLDNEILSLKEKVMSLNKDVDSARLDNEELKLSVGEIVKESYDKLIAKVKTSEEENARLSEINCKMKLFVETKFNVDLKLLRDASELIDNSLSIANGTGSLIDSLKELNESMEYVVRKNKRYKHDLDNDMLEAIKTVFKKLKNNGDLMVKTGPETFSRRSNLDRVLEKFNENTMRYRDFMELFSSIIVDNEDIMVDDSKDLLSEFDTIVKENGDMKWK